MQEDEGVALGQQCPQIVVDRIVQIAAAAAAADGDAGQVQLVQRVPGGLGRARPAQRHRAETDQPVRGTGDVVRQLFVAAPHDAGRELLVVGGRAEQERRQRHCMPVDAGLVHLGQSGGHVMLGQRQWQRGTGADAAHPGVQPDDAAGHAGDIGQVASGQPFEQRQRHRVRMHVEHLGALRRSLRFGSHSCLLCHRRPRALICGDPHCSRPATIAHQPLSLVGRCRRRRGRTSCRRGSLHQGRTLPTT